MSKASSFWSQHSQPFGLWLPAQSSSGNACTAIVWQTHANTKYCWSQMIGCCEANVKARSRESHGIRVFLALAPTLPKTRTFIFPCAPITSQFYIPEKPMNTSDWRLLFILRYPQNLISTSPLHPHSSNDGHASQKANDTRHQKPPAADLGKSLQGAVWKSWVQYNGILTYTSYDRPLSPLLDGTACF